MTTTHRVVVYCDENLTDKCLGLVEYAAADRVALARKADYHTTDTAWLRRYRPGGTHDVCPVCRPRFEARTTPQEQEQHT